MKDNIRVLAEKKIEFTQTSTGLFTKPGYLFAITILSIFFSEAFVMLILSYLPSTSLFKVGLLDWNQTINPLASGIKCAWKVNTVSPSYMDELNNNAHGLEGLLSNESDKCSGNLIDLDSKVWNPESDNYMIINNNNKTVQ